MKTPRDGVPTIRRRLLALLLVPASAILIAGTVLDYFTSIAPIEDAYDQSLVDGALALAGHISPAADGSPELILPAAAVSILRNDSIDSVYFRVATRAGKFVAGDADLPQSASLRSNPERDDAVYRGEPIRRVTYHTDSTAGAVVVTVAETMHKRNRTRARTLSRELAVDIVQLAAVLAILWFGARWALTPLSEVRAQIAKRSARALDPLPLQSVPDEIRSIVESLNRLFATVRESSGAQRSFLQSAAHQLRTPLAGIQAQLELMISDESDAARRERLAQILAAARRLTHTTQQLLLLARSDEAANLSWDFKRVELTTVIESVVADRLAAADAAGIDLGAHIEPVTVDGVAWLLIEALANLADNAIEHTPRGGAVTLRCGVFEGRPVLEAVDTGLGIPEAERERVLERFFRASNARGTGSGLGLAIVQEIAQMHGASVRVAAGPGGEGTQVSLLFGAPASVRQAQVS